METLSLQDLPPAGGPNHVQPAPPPAPASVAQLPPQVTSSPARADDDAETLTAFQMFTTAAQLLDLTDSESYRVMLALERPRTNIAEASATLPANDNFSSASAEKLLLVLRDGRKLIGVLRSWDQFANLVLQDTIERIFVKDLYADIPRGIFLVRGENVLMLGEIDLDKDDYIPEPYQKASPEEVHSLSIQQAAERKRMEKVKHSKLGELGFEVEHTGEVLY